MENRYYSRNRRKYNLKVHIVLATKYRKPLLQGPISDDVKQIVYDVRNANNWDIVAMETDKDHIHLLICYDTTTSVSHIVKTLKQVTTHYLWQKYHRCLSCHYWKRQIFWSDGYFACSIGEVSAATIQHYIETQG
jgi:putative transposase